MYCLLFFFLYFAAKVKLNVSVIFNLQIYNKLAHLLTLYILIFSICFFYKTFLVYHTSGSNRSQPAEQGSIFLCIYFSLMLYLYRTSVYVHHLHPLHSVGKRTDENEGSVPSETYYIRNFDSI